MTPDETRSISVHLHEHLDEKIGMLKELIEARFVALAKETDAAITDNNRRLNQMNEFREQLREQASTFLTKNVYDIRHDKIMEDVQEMQKWRAGMEGKASQRSVNFAYVLVGINLFLTILNLIKDWIGRT